MKNGSKLKIDREFQDCLDELSPEAKEQLRQNLLDDGCLDPIKTWKGENIIVDGHNRHEICEAEGLDYEVVQLEFDTRTDVMRWMWTNQAGRRNLTPERLRFFRGTLYEQAKKDREKNLSAGNDLSKRQSGASKKTTRKPPKSTAATVAEETSSSPRTVQRDAKATASINKLAKPLHDAYLNGSLKLADTELHALAKLPHDEQTKLARRVRTGDFDSWKVALRGKKPARGKEVANGMKLVDLAIKNHVGPLAREIDAIAKVNGGHGAQSRAAHDALHELTERLKQLRGGKK